MNIFCSVKVVEVQGSEEKHKKKKKKKDRDSEQ